MSLFSRISTLFRASSPSSPRKGRDDFQELSAMRQDERLHPRFALPGPDLARLTLDGAVGQVKDLSYGGLAVSFPEDQRRLSGVLPETLLATLTSLDRSIRCQLGTVRTIVAPDGRLALVGFTFRHDLPESLLFLRTMIEPLRRGRSLSPLSPEHCSERYSGPEWSCLRGEGPTDLVFRVRDRQLDEALLTMQTQEHYTELRYQQGQLKTGRSQGTEGQDSQDLWRPGAQMETTHSVDPEVLRQAIYTLAATPPPYGDLLRPLVAAAIHLLTTPARTGAA